jgi:hypothetical protein
MGNGVVSHRLLLRKREVKAVDYALIEGSRDVIYTVSPLDERNPLYVVRRVGFIKVLARVRNWRIRLTGRVVRSTTSLVINSMSTVHLQCKQVLDARKAVPVQLSA